MVPPLSSLARRAGCALARAPKSTELQEQLLPHTAVWEAFHCPSEGPRHRQCPSPSQGVKGCSPAGLAATTRCRAVTHGCTSSPHSPVPVTQLSARSPSGGRNGAPGTLPRAEPESNLFWVCAPHVSLGLLDLSLRFSHIPLHSPGESLTAVGRAQDLGLFLPRYHHCTIPSCLIPALLTAP